MTEPSARNIIFICMGNICRSPMAEGIFLHKIREHGIRDEFTVDSAGTGGWHSGDAPDHRSSRTARARGIMLLSRARKVTPRDFDAFDLLICMDDENAMNLERMGCPPEKIRRLMEYHPESEYREVPDPYYGGEDGFELMYELIDQAIDRLLERLRPSSNK